MVGRLKEGPLVVTRVEAVEVDEEWERTEDDDAALPPEPIEAESAVVLYFPGLLMNPLPVRCFLAFAILLLPPNLFILLKGGGGTRR
mmetsp:Transcript_14951/g.24734  ORF Transcript_14951/g.24734 Transcript_14951/m.24734 type:complete len:87 (+) Transcript_14951:304-564(+)